MTTLDKIDFEELSRLFGLASVEEESAYDQAVDLLERCMKMDTESAHGNADAALCDFLIALGYKDLVDLWDQVPKWYA